MRSYCLYKSFISGEFALDIKGWEIDLDETINDHQTLRELMESDKIYY